MCDRAGSDGEVLIVNERLQRGIEVGRLNTARFQVVAVEMAGEIAVAPHELLPAPDGFLKREIF